jgi:hypothetical protein
MATVKIILNLNKIDPKGQAFNLRLIQNRKPCYVSLGYKLKPHEWDEINGRVKKSHPNSTRLNHYLAQKVFAAQNEALQIIIKNISVFKYHFSIC